MTENHTVTGPVFKTMPSMTIVGYKNIITEETRYLIQECWRLFNENASAFENLENPYPWGVSLMLARNFEYMAGVQVTQTEKRPDGTDCVEVPEAEYAVFTQNGPLDHFPKTMDYIFNTWMPESEYRHTGTPELENYERFNPEKMEGEVDICIPVRPK